MTVETADLRFFSTAAGRAMIDYQNIRLLPLQGAPGFQSQLLGCLHQETGNLQPNTTIKTQPNKTLKTETREM